MRVLVACEFSGVVRDAFRARGHDAWSCDLLPTERPGPHLQGDVLTILGDGWDLMIAHPPCTYLSFAGNAWWKIPERQVKADEAARFVFALRDAPIPRIAIENPRGQLTRRWRYPDQVINPWWFGDPFTKATCLWLKGLPPLMATYIHTGVRPWVNAGSHGKSNGGVARTAHERSRTLPGVACAMADQWGA